MMIINGCLVIIWPMEVMVGWICGWGLIKNCLKPPIATSEPKSSIKAMQTTDRFPAHPYHHLLKDPDDDNQWLFGHHLARGGHGGLDLWLGFDQKLPQATQLLSQNPPSGCANYR
jgi:hypothetical protein